MNVLQTIELEASDAVIVTLEILAEDTPMRGNISASGDDDHDRKIEEAVLAEWEHNNLAWCVLRVVAKLGQSPEIYGDDFLGGVSILEKNLPEGRTLEEEALQMVEYHGMIARAKGELQRAIIGVEMSISDFREMSP